MKGVYAYNGGELEITDDMKTDYKQLGYILVRNLLGTEELVKLKDALEHDEGIMTKSSFLGDGVSNKTKFCVWNHPGNDITGMVGRSNKMVNTLEGVTMVITSDEFDFGAHCLYTELMGGEVYHYHTKLMMKEPHGGGQFYWHQDYGYWYYNGLLLPDMATVFIAVDPCEKKNGCLQVIPGSHLCGRIEHDKKGGQMEANNDRVQHIQEKMGLEHVEMQPGDALFFHCNLLHRSSNNNSDQRRWAFVCAYNRSTNNPVKKHHHPRYVPLIKVSNDAIIGCNASTDMQGKGFILKKPGDNPYDFVVEDEHLN